MTTPLEIHAAEGGPALLSLRGRRLTGELAEDLRHAFGRPEVREANALVVDLHDVHEVDYVTLGVFAGLVDHTRCEGITVTLVGVSEPVANLLVAGGHADLLAVPQQPQRHDAGEPAL